MADWVCGSLIPRLHLTTLLCRLWLQTNLYCADSGSKQISTAQTRAPNDVIYSRWQQPYWDLFASLFYSGRKRRCVVHLFYSLWIWWTLVASSAVRVCFLFCNLCIWIITHVMIQIIWDIKLIKIQFANQDISIFLNMHTFGLKALMKAVQWRLQNTNTDSLYKSIFEGNWKV